MEIHNNISQCWVCKKTELETKSWISRGKKKYHKECFLSVLSYVRSDLEYCQKSPNGKKLSETTGEFMQEYYNSGNARISFNGIINWLNEIIEDVMWNWENMDN